MTPGELPDPSPHQKAAAAVEALSGRRPLADIAGELGVDAATVGLWQQQLARNAATLFQLPPLPPLARDTVLERVTGYAISAELPLLYLPPLPDLDIISARARYFPVQPAATGGDDGLRRFEACTGADCLAMQERYRWLEARVSHLAARHMQAKQALVRRIGEHEQTAQALQASESRLHQLLSHQEGRREEERRRVARDIHDELGQYLMALRIDISALHARSMRPQGKLYQWVNAALSNVDHAIRSVKTIINELRPFELELGLLAALQWQVDRFGRNSGIDCRLTVGGPLPDYEIGERHTLVLFRALQEVLAAIRRQEAARAVTVALSSSHAGLQLTVRTEGARGPQQGGIVDDYTLAGARLRLRELGGELLLSETPECVVLITLPPETAPGLPTPPGNSVP